MIDSVTAAGNNSGGAPRDPRLWAAAQKMETAFLNEMMKAAGLGQPLETFSGGPGEEQFSSFLRQEQVRRMVDAGGIGMAEGIYRALVTRAGNQ